MKRSVYAPQTAVVLRHLKDKGPLTQQEAAQLYQVWRLSARVKDLRYAEWSVVTEMVHAGEKKFARYWLVSDIQGSTRGLFPTKGGDLQ